MYEYKKVKFITNKFINVGIMFEMTGYIIEKYPGGKYEVEVSDKYTGETIALVVASDEDLEMVN